jgi:hypothetical protein
MKTTAAAADDSVILFSLSSDLFRVFTFLWRIDLIFSHGNVCFISSGIYLTTNRLIVVGMRLLRDDLNDKLNAVRGKIRVALRTFNRIT